MAALMGGPQQLAEKLIRHSEALGGFDCFTFQMDNAGLTHVDKINRNQFFMNNLENYANLIEQIFGTGTVTFNRTGNYTNNVIGALNRTNDFHLFRDNFSARLRRLQSIYRNDSNSLKEVLNAVNNIARRGNWQGAFAELAAFDHLNYQSFPYSILEDPIRLNVTLPAFSSFAEELGGDATNVDGFVEEFGLYFDVKCLKDNITEILEGIYSELEDHLGISHLPITAEFDKHASYLEYKDNRKQLRDELFREATLTAKPTTVVSKVVNNLTYRILWNAGVSVATSGYHPYEHAMLYHKTVFDYANKFIKGSRSIIVLVSFPWYNGIITDFAHSNTRFYRALARRVFCQYIHDNSSFQTIDPGFTGPHSVHEVSRHVSGILFLEDNTILSEAPNQSNVKSFVYYNPNAINPISKTRAKTYIESLNNEDFDDFEFDNY